MPLDNASSRANNRNVTSTEPTLDQVADWLRVATDKDLRKLAHLGFNLAIQFLAAADAALRAKAPSWQPSGQPRVTVVQVAAWFRAASDEDLVEMGRRHPGAAVKLVSLAYLAAKSQSSKERFALEIEDVLRRYAGSATLQALNGP
jgi:hypothetical protein